MPTPTVTRYLLGAALVAAAVLMLLALAPSAAPGRAGEDGSFAPVYGEGQELHRPQGYEHWVFVGASIGLSYNDTVTRHEGDPGMFHSVFLEPSAYDHYQRTGEFPDKTMLVLELYDADEKVAPSKHGYFSGTLRAVEVALKDEERFEGSWAYFDFGLDKETATPFPAARCQSCHVEHAATDNVFTQFYPRLRR